MIIQFKKSPVIKVDNIHVKQNGIERIIPVPTNVLEDEANNYRFIANFNNAQISEHPGLLNKALESYKKAALKYIAVCIDNPTSKKAYIYIKDFIEHLIHLNNDENLYIKNAKDFIKSENQVEKAFGHLYIGFHTMNTKAHMCNFEALKHLVAGKILITGNLDPKALLVKQGEIKVSNKSLGVHNIEDSVAIMMKFIDPKDKMQTVKIAVAHVDVLFEMSKLDKFLKDLTDNGVTEILVSLIGGRDFDLPQCAEDNIKKVEECLKQFSNVKIQERKFGEEVPNSLVLNIDGIITNKVPASDPTLLVYETLRLNDTILDNSLISKYFLPTMLKFVKQSTVTIEINDNKQDVHTWDWKSNAVKDYGDTLRSEVEQLFTNNLDSISTLNNVFQYDNSIMRAPILNKKPDHSLQKKHQFIQDFIVEKEEEERKKKEAEEKEIVLENAKPELKDHSDELKKAREYQVKQDFINKKAKILSDLHKNTKYEEVIDHYLNMDPIVRSEIIESPIVDKCLKDSYCKLIELMRFANYNNISAVFQIAYNIYNFQDAISIGRLPTNLKLCLEDNLKSYMSPQDHLISEKCDHTLENYEAALKKYRSEIKDSSKKILTQTYHFYINKVYQDALKYDNNNPMIDIATQTDDVHPLGDC